MVYIDKHASLLHHGINYRGSGPIFSTTLYLNISGSYCGKNFYIL